MAIANLITHDEKNTPVTEATFVAFRDKFLWYFSRSLDLEKKETARLDKAYREAAETRLETPEDASRGSPERVSKRRGGKSMNTLLKDALMAAGLTVLAAEIDDIVKIFDSIMNDAKKLKDLFDKIPEIPEIPNIGDFAGLSAGSKVAGRVLGGSGTPAKPTARAAARAAEPARATKAAETARATTQPKPPPVELAAEPTTGEPTRARTVIPESSGTPKKISVKDAIKSVAGKLDAKIMNSPIMKGAVKALNWAGKKLVVVDAIMQSAPIVTTLAQEFLDPGTTRYAGLTPDDFYNGDADKIVGHTEFSRDVGAAIGHVLGGLGGGALGGAILGAAGGTLIMPGLGTTILGVAGGVGGYMLGSEVGEYLGPIMTDILAGREVELIRDPAFLAKLEEARKSLNEKDATPENVQAAWEQRKDEALQRGLGGVVDYTSYSKPEESIFDRRIPTQLEVQQEYEYVGKDELERRRVSDILMQQGVMPGDESRKIQEEKLRQLRGQGGTGGVSSLPPKTVLLDPIVMPGEPPIVNNISGGSSPKQTQPPPATMPPNIETRNPDRTMREAGKQTHAYSDPSLSTFVFAP